MNSRDFLSNLGTILVHVFFSLLLFTHAFHSRRFCMEDVISKLEILDEGRQQKTQDMTKNVQLICTCNTVRTVDWSL